MSQITKPYTLQTKEECTEALVWIGVKLDQMESSFHIRSSKVFSPKRWKQQLTAFLWSKDVVQVEINGKQVVQSPFLYEVETSAREDSRIQQDDYISVKKYLHEVEAVVDKHIAKFEEAIEKAQSAAAKPKEVDVSSLEKLSEGELNSVISHDKAVLQSRSEAVVNDLITQLEPWHLLSAHCDKLNTRIKDTVALRKKLVVENYRRQCFKHLKLANRCNKLSPPYVLPGILAMPFEEGDENVAI